MKTTQLITGRAARCAFCGGHCQVPVARTMPRHLFVCYTLAGIERMATCVGGMVFECGKLGVCYADVLDERESPTKGEG